MQQRRTFMRGIVFSYLAAYSGACGGRAEPTPFDGPLDGPADYRVPRYPDPGSTGDLCADPPSSLRTKLLWEQSLPLYGMDAVPYFAFSGDGSKLITPSDQYGKGNGLFAVADGARITGTKARVLGRDAAWSRELRGPDLRGPAGEVSVVDLELEQTLLSLGPVSQLVRLSADGKYVFGVYCHDRDRLERRGISDGEVTVVPLSAELSPCPLDYYTGYVDLSAPFVVSSSNDSAAFLADQGRDLVLASLSAGTTSAHTLYEAAPPDQWPPADMIVGLALAPSQRALSTVNGTGVLRIWSYPGLVQSLPDIQLSVTHAFSRGCYCAPRDFAPVAWSPDERYLATANEAGNTVLRRACSGSVVTTLQAPKQASSFEGYAQGPAFIAWSPNGRGLAVLSISEEYDGTVSYYELSE